MKRLIMMLSLVGLLQACASTDCEFLAYQELPTESEALDYPEGVRVPTSSGAFQVPDVSGQVSGECLAQPPMTLPPEVLEEPDEDAPTEDPETETET